MVTRPPQHDQQPGTLIWSYALDLTRLDPIDLLDEVPLLHRPWASGKHINVHVGSVRPGDLDPRVAYGLVEAMSNGVHIAISGTPSAVPAWWKVLKPRQPARHLQAVPQ